MGTESPLEVLPTVHTPLVIPGPRAVMRHAWPNVLLGKVIPVALFVGFFDLVGVAAALLAALGWSLAVIVHRLSTGRPIPGLVLVSTIGLVAKTILALATGSLLVYFLQPTVSTALVGLAFLASVPLGRPLAGRLAQDFCPFDAEAAEHPMLRLFFLRLSLIWAITSLANATLTLYLLLTQPVTTFVIIKSFMGPSFTVATLATAALWFRGRMKREGLTLEFGTSLAISG